MINQVKILTPGPKCDKCLKLDQQVERAIQLSEQNTEIEIIDSIVKNMNYQTWIPQTFILNENNTTSGYAPPIEKYLTYYI